MFLLHNIPKDKSLKDETNNLSNPRILISSSRAGYENILFRYKPKKTIFSLCYFKHSEQSLSLESRLLEIYNR